MTQLMKTNKISKIVIEDNKIQLTTQLSTQDNMESDSSEIVKLMNNFNVIKCEYNTSHLILNIKLE